jgi:hypothetical protein
MEHVGDHFAGDIVVEFFDLILNVAQTALLDQRPIITIRNMGHLPRNIAIAAPERMACVPISLAAMWRVSSPIAKMDVFDVVVLPDGGDQGVAVGSQVGLYPANNGSSCPDWAQCNIAR